MSTPTKLQLYNQALRLIGEGSLTTVTDSRPERYALDKIWDEDPIKQMLEETYWAFATRTLEWNYNSAVEPAFGYRYAFDRPANYVRSVAICQDEFFTAPLTDYNIEAGYLYCELQTIYWRYVSDADDYGRDMSLWTELFRNCVAAKMAKELAIGLSKSDAVKEGADRELQRYLKDAKSMNAQEKPTQYLRPGSWTRNRMGGGRYRGSLSSDR